MEDNREYRQQLVSEYKVELMPLLAYLPWFMSHSGKAASKNYEGNEIEGHTISFPVYDSTVLNFVKLASKTGFMDKNYRYVFTRHHLTNHDAERKAIEKAGIEEWNVLCGILSKYVLGGYTKGTLWNEAVVENIFTMVLEQMKSIVEYWDVPITVEDGTHQTISQEEAWKQAAEEVLRKKAEEAKNQ
ncbi:MAG: hypothetical protein J6033_00105 [Lachnospiraceae bacterium]|nr:hypothetical protein [Lachnospiraceae bacterium]